LLVFEGFFLKDERVSCMLESMSPEEEGNLNKEYGMNAYISNIMPHTVINVRNGNNKILVEISNHSSYNATPTNSKPTLMLTKQAADKLKINGSEICTIQVPYFDNHPIANSIMFYMPFVGVLYVIVSKVFH
jgi:hypothetical protein